MNTLPHIPCREAGLFYARNYGFTTDRAIETLIPDMTVDTQIRSLLASMAYSLDILKSTAQNTPSPSPPPKHESHIAADGLVRCWRDARKQARAQEKVLALKQFRELAAARKLAAKQAREAKKQSKAASNVAKPVTEPVATVSHIITEAERAVLLPGLQNILKRANIKAFEQIAVTDLLNVEGCGPVKQKQLIAWEKKCMRARRDDFYQHAPFSH